MSEPPPITPHSFQILAVRELRKVGFAVGDVRIHRRSELPEPERGFVLELVVPLSRPETKWSGRVLAVCRRQEGAVDRAVVEGTKARLPDAKANAAIVFATGDFTGGAVAGAQDSGIALLRVVDSRTVFDPSGWSTPGHYPAWLPAYLTQLVDQDSAGQPRARLLEAGRADMILACLAPRAGEQP